MPLDPYLQTTADLGFPRFRERFPWWGGDLQTIATLFLSKPALNSEQMQFRADEQNTLIAMLDRPAPPDPRKPLVLLIHGVPGSAESADLRRLSGHLVGIGHYVLRLNLRGAGTSRPVCAGQYFAGSSADIRAVVELLPTALAKHGIVAEGIVAVGHSIGGAVLLKYLGEEGSKSKIKAAVSVSAPIDLRDTCVNLLRLRNLPYLLSVMRGIKQDALGKGAVLTPTERTNIEYSTDLWTYDDLFTAPRNNFSGAEDYYSRCSASNFLPDIKVPTLVVASLDDPWVPGNGYVGFRWGANENLTPLLLPRGGHVGFHGRSNKLPWSDLAAAAFLSR